jgi:periplasmic divalent cation tolerance protein
MESPADPRVVLVTAPDDAIAERLARSFVSAGLAACVNRVPGVISTYRWEGEVTEDAEVLLIVKTTAGRLEALEDAVAAEHPYETPEFVALEPVLVSAPYLAWLRESVAQDEGA